MGDGTDTTGTSPSPDEAFATLGNETRMGILRTLGSADGPLSFSELYDRSDADDSGQFNYHLDKLVGHFVEKTEDGYALARPGRRVVEAVLSGAVTGAPELERTGVDASCRHCGAPMEVQWQGGSVELYCTECAGTYGQAYDDAGTGRQAPAGYLGRLPFTPAGLRDRTPAEVLRAAWTWGNLEIMAMASGLCPRCGASIERSVRVCETHDGDERVCGSCNRTHAAAVVFACPNCVFQSGGVASLALLADRRLLDFQTDHGINPVAPSALHRADRLQNGYDETVRSTDPFEAQFTFTADDEALTLTVDESLTVVDADRS